MDHPDRGRAFPVGSRSETGASTALLTWDELSAAELHALERDEHSGPILNRLRAAEDFLRSTLAARPCPTAEELYDFARGPGAEALPEERRAEFEDHVAHCSPCTRLTASLASAPPPPLEIVDPTDVAGSAGPFAVAVTETPAAPLRRMRWLPVAAAAAVLLGGWGLFHGNEDVEPGGWPERPVLRNTGEEPLWFTRGPVLENGITLSGGAPTFEFDRIDGAERVRVDVFLHDGSAFGEGTLVDEIQGFEPPLRGNVQLAPGHYTWAVWARVDGLESLVGELDFRVVEEELPGDEAIPASTLEDLRRLHAAGFVTDARSLARTLPPSSDRDEYLAPPGR